MDIKWKNLTDTNEDVDDLKTGTPLYSRTSQNSSSPSPALSFNHSSVFGSELKKYTRFDSNNDRPSNKLDFLSTLPSSTPQNSNPHYIASATKNSQIDSSRYSSLSSTIKKLQQDDYESTKSSLDFNKEISSHPPILQPLTTHRASTLHQKHLYGALNGHSEVQRFSPFTGLVDDGNIERYSMDMYDDDLKNSKIKRIDEEKSFASIEFDSSKYDPNGYEMLRIQHFKVELKELKKELQFLKDENENLSKENHSLKESLRRFHSNSIVTNAEAEVSTMDNGSIASYLRDIQTEEVSLPNFKHLDENITTVNKTNKRLTNRRRFSICSTSTENILHEADVLIKRTNQEKLDINIGKTRDQKLSTSTLNSLSDIRTLYLNEPGSKLDVKMGDRVKFVCKEGNIEGGRIMYVGGLPEKDMMYVGLELDDEVGKHDGIFKGQRYFQCKRNRGIFVAANKILPS